MRNKNEMNEPFHEKSLIGDPQATQRFAILTNNVFHLNKKVNSSTITMG